MPNMPVRPHRAMIEKVTSASASRRPGARLRAAPTNESFNGKLRDQCVSYGMVPRVEN
jgi:hypothetical protein